MPKLFHKFVAVVGLALLAGMFLLAGSRAYADDPQNTLYLDLPAGRVVIEMHPEWAPKHVARIKELVRRGFYDGLNFHRVIKGFMAQTGDPNGDGTGGTGHKLKGEFSDQPFVRGIVGMARGDDPDSADSQFFIMTGPKHSLDHEYTAWGRVVSGMEYVDALKSAAEEDNGIVDNPDKVVQIQLAADVDKGKS